VPLADNAFLLPSFGAAFVLLWFGLFVVGFGGFMLAVAALISIATTPVERFGPWWDNTRQVWLIGTAVSFVVPFGNLVAGFCWFTTGRRGLRDHGVAGRPFWAAAPRPAPPVAPVPPATWPPPAGPGAWPPPPPAS
jgi:hypothetical protein